MYYLNSDGSPDATVVDEFRSCHCESCKKKRRRKQHSWFSYTNILLLIILIIAILVMTVDSKQLMKVFDFSNSSPVTTVAAPPAANTNVSSKNTEAGFELPLL
jgi:hypothetical protein